MANGLLRLLKSWTEVYQAYDKEKFKARKISFDPVFTFKVVLTINTYNKEVSQVLIVREDIGSNCPRKKQIRSFRLYRVDINRQ